MTRDYCDDYIKGEDCTKVNPRNPEATLCPCPGQKQFEAEESYKRAIWKMVGFAVLGLFLGMPLGVLIFSGKPEWYVPYGIVALAVLFVVNIYFARSLNPVSTSGPSQ